MITKRFRKRKVKEQIFIYAVLLYPLLQFSIFYVAVNFNSVLLAFRRYELDLSVSYVGLENFRQVFASLTENSGLLKASILNSLTIFASTLLIGLPLNILFSFYIYKKKFAASYARFVLFLPAIVSGVIMALIFLKFSEIALPAMLKKIGIQIPILLLNDSTALWTIVFYLLWTGFASSLIIYPNAMNTIPTELTESAKIDGASPLRELWHITIPLIYPTITTFMVTGTATLFTFQGPLFLFYGYEAPGSVYNTGYFLFRGVMKSEGLSGYPFSAASGIVLTFISVPVTLLVKFLMERFGPVSDY